MINKSFNDLYKILKFNSQNDLENRRARLFPNGKCKVEDETVTCSIFLATLVGIKEFQEKLIGSLSSKNSSRITNQSSELHAFTELKNTEGRPDGLLVLTTGKRDKVISWAAYVEVKTKGQLGKEQIERYLNIAKNEKVPDLITISNDFVTFSDINPTGVNKNNLFHWSWHYIISELFQLKIKNRIEDSDQVYFAGELIKYLEGHCDISDFSDMGPSWEEDAKCIVDGHKLSKNSQELNRLVTCWVKEEADISLKLSSCILKDSGCHRAEIDLTREEKSSYTAHEKSLLESILKNGEFSTDYIIKDLNKKHFPNDKLKKLSVSLKFRGRKFIVSMKIPSKSGKAISQTTQLLKQLSDSGLEDEILISANFGRKQSGQVTLKELNHQNEYNEPYSIIDEDKKKDEIKDFKVNYEKDLGRDFYSRKKIISVIENATIQFYREVTARFF